MNFLIPIVAVFLIFVSIIDWKTKQIPSIILTGMLFVVLILNPTHVLLGIASFVIAWLLYEADFISGIADIKATVIVGLMLSSLSWFFLYVLLLCAYGLFWKVLIKWRMKRAKKIAFLPVFLFLFITLWILGGIK